MNNPYAALICDLDMTLIDSRRDIAASAAWAIEQSGRPAVPEDRIFPYIGKGLSTMFDELLPDADPKERARIMAFYKGRFYRHCNDRTRVFPHVFEVLDELRVKGVKTAVATAKMSFMADRVCEVLNLKGRFDHIQGTDGFPGKPDPTVLFIACRALGIMPERAVFVGDTSMDVEAGRLAGCRVLAATWGIGSREELTKTSPDRLLDSFDQVIGEFDPIV